MKTDKVLLGVLGGLAAGAILGILYAPEKGNKTRGKIKDKSVDYADNLKEKFDTALDTISKKFDDLKSETKTAYAEGKEKVKDAAKEVENETERYKAQV
ncbi:YtxH domain-containing protein [Flavobacterium sp. 14A]|uniref:YtxH domain-containing protein n=1 Tax=Flavobacterium sp. 14A TaxID=2735896 RepID=UPI00156EC012|nr:YtxH domain-containing protein [Flavobacterium sp. 14A]NRT12642.1 gas vesicle protein [Flavobacterium sp. 14A]